MKIKILPAWWLIVYDVLVAVLLNHAAVASTSEELRQRFRQTCLVTVVLSIVRYIRGLSK